MVEIKPLKGILYNYEKVDFKSVITPPNDVISDAEQADLEKNQHSFVKLIKPKGDYQHSNGLFRQWLDQGILKQDSEDSIYVYEQSYMINNQQFKRIGFMALLKLEELGKGILPHEKILEEDLKDRVELIKTTKSNFGVPFVLYDDKQKITDNILKQSIQDQKPYIDFLNGDDVNHKLWKVTDQETINKLAKEMEKHQCIIADGHHRYTSALRVKDIYPQNKKASYALLCFVNSYNEGMVILPTNRIIFGLKNPNSEDIKQKISESFDIQEIDDIKLLAKTVKDTDILIDKEINLKNHVFGVYDNITKKGYLLKLKNTKLLEELFPDKTDISRKLDVNILHKLIIEEIFGITREQQKHRQHIDFVKGNKETIKKTDENIQFVLFVNPPLMREVFLSSRAGEVMPQKSTYFFPKIYSGLVIYSFNEV